MKVDALPSNIKDLIKYRTDPWLWAVDNVNTLDQVDKIRPIKPFPRFTEKREDDYMNWYYERLKVEPLIALVKHRRMLITWGSLTFLTHEILHYEGRFIAIVSKKEEDADDLVQRCYFIYTNIKERKKDLLMPEAKYKYTEMVVPELNSIIKAVPQGPDQLRQYTCSRIFGDEVITWPEARATFVAMRPTLEGGGQVALVSTRKPGFFKQLIEDTLDEAA